ncbi:MAG: RNA polymerase sigma-70 factor [Janthinobacterium lividum]
MHLHKQFNDVELLILLKEGQETALAAIYRKYWKRLYAAANFVLKDTQACEDIIQEIFLKLWLARKDIQVNISLLSYLYASVRHEVFRQIKSGKVREDIFDNLCECVPSEPGYENIEYKELYMQINASVEQLPDRCKIVYKLSREEYLSHKQIAAQLNISTKTVENHLTKALSFLRLSINQLLTLSFLAVLFNK